MKIGDKATISIDAESRSWGNNPAPDGTEVEVVGFGESYHTRTQGANPGVYENLCWPKVKLPDGSVIAISSCHLKFERKGSILDGKFLRELPETAFWEGDKVRHCGVEVVVQYIEYQCIGARRTDGSPMPIYSVKYPAGYSRIAGDDELTLVERGNLWKHYHGEPVSFSSLEEECIFNAMIGLEEELRNPATGNYAWTKDQVLEAIRSGAAHGMKMSSGFFGTTPSPYAVRFKNEELGRRVAEATLAGFA